MMKKLLSLLLIPCLLLGLTACGKDGGGSEKTVFQAAPSYTAEKIALPVDEERLSGIYGWCSDGDALYGLTAVQDGAPVLFRFPLGGGETEILSEFHPPETGKGESLFYRGPVLGGDGKLWVWEQFSSDQAKSTTLRQLDPVTGRELRTVDAAALGKARDLTGLAVDRDGNIYAATGKEIAVLDSNGQAAFTLKAETGKDVGSFGTLALLPEGDVIALINVSENQQEIRTIHFDEKDWGEERYVTPRSTAGIYSGSGGYQFFSLRSGALYGRLAGEKLDTFLLSWDAAGPEVSGVDGFALSEDGQVVLLADTAVEGGVQQTRQALLRLTPSDRLPWEGKTRLVYGTIGDDGWARRRVSQFNEESSDYYIELRDYAEGMLDYRDGSYLQVRDAALARLSGEILAGRAPDILDDREIPLAALARQGVLTDLWPMIEGDPELGREGVMEHVLECAETDGKLCWVFSNFRIDTMVASAEAAAGRTSWTLEEMLEAYGGEMPEIYDAFPLTVTALASRISANSLLDRLLCMDLSRYVDWETGTCSFDSDEFRNVLRLCGEVDGDSAGSVVTPVFWDGQPVVYYQCLDSIDDLCYDDVAFGGPDALLDYESLLTENGILSAPVEVDGQLTGITDDCLQYAEQARETGSFLLNYPVMADFISGTLEHTGNAAYIGFPTSGGSGSSFRVQDCLAITSACADKEGAWQFVRQLLLPGGSLAGSDGLKVSYDAFPVNRADFQQLTTPQPEWFTDEAGSEILDQHGERIEKAQNCFIVGDPGILMVFQRSVRQEQVDRLMALYESTDHIEEEDQGLTDLICEQAGAYFAGEKTLDETVELIQNRAALYVNEQK